MCKKSDSKRHPPRQQQRHDSGLEATVRKIYLLGLLYLGSEPVNASETLLGIN